MKNREKPLMQNEDFKFVHDILNKLAKVKGYSGLLSDELGQSNDMLIKIEKAADEAIELVSNYKEKLDLKE